MPNIEKYQRNSIASSASKINLFRQLFEQIPEGYNAVELVISLEENAIKIKELSAYLDIIYRFDAHLSEVGFNRYIHYPNLQVEIDEIRFGSWEIIIQRFLDSVDADKLDIIYLALKFLPKIVQTFSGNIYRYYEILDKREDFLEKRDKRIQRKKMRELINQEFEFSNFDKKQREKLVDILEQLYQKTDNKLVPASRLASKTIKNLKLNPIKKKSSY
jgi:hypothetical protein